MSQAPANGATKATRRAWGHSVGGKKQIAVRMPAGIFQVLKAQAIKENRPMQHKILDYITVGLEVDRDWDIDEPERHCKAAGVPPAIRPETHSRSDLPDLQGMGKDFWDG